MLSVVVPRFFTIPGPRIGVSSNYLYNSCTIVQYPTVAVARILYYYIILVLVSILASLIILPDVPPAAARALRARGGGGAR